MENKQEIQTPEISKRGNFILRQELKTLTPDCNIKCSVICNLILMVIFFVFGGCIVASSNSFIEIEKNYSYTWYF